MKSSLSARLGVIARRWKSGSSARRRCLAVVPLIGGTLFCGGGCDPIKAEAAARELAASVDRFGDKVTREFAAAVLQARIESQEWRDEIQRIADRYEQLAARFPQEVGIELKGYTDFLLHRLKCNSTATARITQLLRDRRYGEALSAFRELRSANPLGTAPEISSAVPNSLSMVWDDSRTPRPDVASATVSFSGFDFDFPTASRLSAEVRDENDQVLRDVSRHLKVSTRYRAQLDIGTGSGMRFDPRDRTILIRFDGRIICQLPITFPKLLASELRAGIRVSDQGTSGGEAGPEQMTGWSHLQPGWSAFAFDANSFKPDGAWLCIEAATRGARVVLIDKDVRLAIQLTNANGSAGEVRYTPWASEGGGWSAWALDGTGRDFDGARISLEIREARGIVIEDLRLGLQFADDGTAIEWGDPRFTPWLIAEGGGRSSIAVDQNAYDPDSVRLCLDVRVRR